MDASQCQTEILVAYEDRGDNSNLDQTSDMGIEKLVRYEIDPSEEIKTMQENQNTDFGVQSYNLSENLKLESEGAGMHPNAKAIQGNQFTNKWNSAHTENFTIEASTPLSSKLNKYSESSHISDKQSMTSEESKYRRRRSERKGGNDNENEITSEIQYDPQVSSLSEI